MNNCYYCGEEAKYEINNNKFCCKPYHSQCPSVREKSLKKEVKNYDEKYDDEYLNNFVLVENSSIKDIVKSIILNRKLIDYKCLWWFVRHLE